jgi:hypothetical protein
VPVLDLQNIDENLIAKRGLVVEDDILRINEERRPTRHVYIHFLDKEDLLDWDAIVVDTPGNHGHSPEICLFERSLGWPDVGTHRRE